MLDERFTAYIHLFHFVFTCTCVFSYYLQGSKCIIAAILLFIVIPLLLGHLVNLLLISPLRVPMHKTPIFYFSTVRKYLFCSNELRVKITRDVWYNCIAYHCQKYHLFPIQYHDIWNRNWNVMKCPFRLYLSRNDRGNQSKLACYECFRYKIRQIGKTMFTNCPQYRNTQKPILYPDIEWKFKYFNISIHITHH